MILKKYLNSGVYALGVISYSLIQWLILTMITRYLSLEEGGKYAYYFAIFTPLFIFFSFGLRNSIATDRESNFLNSSYIFVQKVGFSCFCIFSMAYLYFEDWDKIGCLVFFIKAADLLSELPYGNWVKQGLVYKYGLSRILKSVSFVILFFIFYKIYGAKEWMFFIYPLIILLVYIFYDRKCEIYTDILAIRVDNTFDLIRNNLPLALGSLVVCFSGVIPRFFLEYYQGFKDVAIFSIAIYIYSIGAMPLTIMLQMILPKFLSNEFKDLKILNKIKFLTFFYIILFSVLVFFSLDAIMIYIYRADYIFSILETLCLIIYGFNQLVLVYLNTRMIGVRNFNGFGFSSIMILIANVLLNIIFISSYGLFGAFLSLLIVSFFSLIITLFFMKKGEKNV